MHIFKVEPIEFHCGVDAVYERKRIKQNCKIFVLNNCPNGFTITRHVRGGQKSRFGEQGKIPGGPFKFEVPTRYLKRCGN